MDIEHGSKNIFTYKTIFDKTQIKNLTWQKEGRT